jgi:hypothetical protein
MPDIQSLPREIVLIEQAAAFLAECQDLDEVRSLGDQAEALRLYHKKAGDSQRAMNAAAECKIRAERREGELLREMAKHQGGPERVRSHDATSPPRLADLGITKSESSRTQAIAAIPVEEFEEVIAEAKGANTELTSQEMIARGQRHQRSARKVARIRERAEAGRAPATGCLLLQGDARRIPLPDRSVDLVFGSPPFMDARTYGIGAQRDCAEWISWMLDMTAEALRVARNCVIWMVGGVTRDRNYWPGPEGLLYEWWRCGGSEYRPCYWHRVGIPGSGGTDWFRAEVDYALCFKRPGELPWSDNTACGHPPRWAPGGAMSHCVSNGTRRNQWGHSGTGDRADRRKDGSTGSARRPSHRIATRAETPGEGSYDPPALANPGNLLSVVVGGGLMGDELAHENEAPFPEGVPEFFIKSLCPPGGIVLDPFSGSGTTVAVARRLGRDGIGMDIRRSQAVIARRRIDGPMSTLAVSGELASDQPEEN